MIGLARGGWPRALLGRLPSQRSVFSGATVTIGLSFRKAFSPIPLMFISSSISLWRIRQRSIHAGEREVRPPAAPNTEPPEFLTVETPTY